MEHDLTINLNIDPCHHDNHAFREFAATVMDALANLADGQHQTMNAITSLRRKMMALSDVEQQALNNLMAQLDDLANDIDTALNAALAANAAMAAQVTSLEALRDQLVANGQADAATISALNDQIAAMQTAVDTHASEVVAGLQGLSDKITATDDHVTTLGGGGPVEPPVDPNP